MTDTPEASRDFQSDTLQRLATLEERTRAKPKSFLERLQSYGGLMALVITIGYSWPLGIWDRFVLNPEKAVATKVDGIRESLARATGLYVEFGRLQSSIAEPEVRDFATRSTANQILLLITKHDADYARYRDKLFPEELLIIGIMYQNQFRIEDSLRYFEYALEHQQASAIVRLEANRQRAKSYLFPSPIQDQIKARSIYKTILPEGLQSQRLDIASQAILIQSEWGLLEMMGGDWKCGVDNMDAAIERLKALQPMINDRGNTLSMFVSKRQSVSLRPGQPQVGC